jgi:hypothetical protein
MMALLRISVVPNSAEVQKNPDGSVDLYLAEGAGGAGGELGSRPIRHASSS